MTVAHRVAVDPGHRWSSAHICYRGRILMNSEGVDLLVFTPMDQSLLPHHHIIVSVGSLLDPTDTMKGLFICYVKSRARVKTFCSKNRRRRGPHVVCISCSL